MVDIVTLVLVTLVRTCFSSPLAPMIFISLERSDAPASPVDENQLADMDEPEGVRLDSED